MDDMTPDDEQTTKPASEVPEAEPTVSEPMPPTEEQPTVEVESARPDDPDALSAVPVVPSESPAYANLGTALVGAPATPTSDEIPPAEPYGEPPAPAPEPAPDKSRRGLTLVVGIVIGALIGGAAGGAVSFATRNDKTTVHEVVSKTVEVGNQAQVGQTIALGALLKRVEPAVVAIRTSDSADGLSGSNSLPQGGSAGTGFVIESNGIILTNYHVVQGAVAIDATFTDGTRKTAKVLGKAPDSDIAVLKVDATNLATLKLGNSDAAIVGIDVVAIGNALALEGGLSVTTGILSGKDRTIKTENGNQLREMLQTDAAINPGNSGGPLVNSAGQVIGINTATADPAAYGGIGFAISINTVKPLIADLENGKSIRRAYLGISSVSNSSALAKENDLAVDTGAVIARVESRSPADDAGLKRKDVVVKFDGVEITSAEELTAAVHGKKPGDKVEIELYRGKDKKTVTAVLAEAPEEVG